MHSTSGSKEWKWKDHHEFYLLEEGASDPTDALRCGKCGHSPLKCDGGFAECVGWRCPICNAFFTGWDDAPFAWTGIIDYEI